MRKLKAGIVGCGGIANGKHLPAMKKSGLYEIVAFCDIIRAVSYTHLTLPTILLV